jgi:hypothetical protein
MPDEENEYYWNTGFCHPIIDVGLGESVKEKNDDDDDDLTFIKTTMFLSSGLFLLFSEQR